MTPIPVLQQFLCPECRNILTIKSVRVGIELYCNYDTCARYHELLVVPESLVPGRYTGDVLSDIPR